MLEQAYLSFYNFLKNEKNQVHTDLVYGTDVAL